MAAHGAQLTATLEPARARVAPGRALAVVLTGICLLALWELAARTRLPSYVARPSGIIGAIPSTVSQMSFWSDLLATVGAILEGVAIGAVAGIALGVVMGRVREVGWFFTPYIRGLYSMPLIALVPLATLWLGYSPTARLVIIIISAFLPIAVTTADGARSVSEDHLDVGRIFGARAHQVWLGIAIPSALPHIMAGLDIGLGRAVTNAVAVEVLASVEGVGYTLFAQSQSFHQDVSFVYVVALAAFAVAARALIRAGSRKLAPWYRPRQGAP